MVIIFSFQINKMASPYNNGKSRVHVPICSTPVKARSAIVVFYHSFSEI